MFIIIVFRLGSDKLVCCLFYRLSQGISHEMWLLAWGMVDEVIVFKSILFLLIRFHYVFFYLLYSADVSYL